MSRRRSNIKPARTTKSPEPATLPAIPDGSAAIAAYTVPERPRRLAVVLGVLAAGVIGAFVGAIWLTEYLPMTQRIDQWNSTLVEQQSKLQDLGQQLHQQTDLIQSLQNRPVVVPPDEETRKLRQEFRGFRSHLDSELGAMRENWNSVIARLEADLASRNRELAWVHYQLGTNYMDQHRFTEAITELQKAIDLTPDNPVFWNQLGYCYLESESIAKAIQAFQEYVRIAPDDANAHDSLAEGYLRAGELKAAEKEYLRAIQLDPGLGSAHYGLGQVYERQGFQQLAVTQYEHTLQRFAETPNRWTRLAQERLTSLASQRNAASNPLSTFLIPPKD